MTANDPLTTALQFVVCINQRNLVGLADLMTADHTFVDLTGEAHVGREEMTSGWAGYMSMCPEYLIHLREIHVLNQTVAMVGSTTGSHTNQPPQEELADLLIWLAVVSEGKVAEWRLESNSPDNRRRLGIDA